MMITMNPGAGASLPATHAPAPGDRAGFASCAQCGQQVRYAPTMPPGSRYVGVTTGSDICRGVPA